MIENSPDLKSGEFFVHTAQEKPETGDEKVVFSSVCGLPKEKKIGILICQDYISIAETLQTGGVCRV